MWKRLVIYGAVLALGTFALEWAEYQHLSRTFTTEIYIILIAIAFLVLGVWVGGKLTSGRPPGEPFKRNEAAIRTLGITPKEYEVLELLAAGQSNKEIARGLNVSPNTIKSHVGRLFTKLEVQRRTQAIQRARELNIIA